MRRLYIVTYDISNPRRLRKVFKTMRGFGDHLQLLVFQCDLTPVARIQMEAALVGIINHKEDQVLIIDLGATDIHALGRPMAVGERGPIIV
jgi:CRISPR-associated protein Cas2